MRHRTLKRANRHNKKAFRAKVSRDYYRRISRTGEWLLVGDYNLADMLEESIAIVDFSSAQSVREFVLHRMLSYDQKIASDKIPKHLIKIIDYLERLIKNHWDRRNKYEAQKLKKNEAPAEI